MKTAIRLSLFVAVMTAYIFLQYGAISPIDNITGCYVANLDSARDRVCLNKSGQFEQYHQLNGKELKYNESNWRSFNYSSDKNEFVAATLNEFIIIDSRGEVLSELDLDIQPHKNTFDKVQFSIRTIKERRIYYRENQDLTEVK